ncbi:hypothetical protein FA743_15085 [Paracoccus gahaiensis]|uniref:Uncharacterized protein n=1 Tax=Paracoccus gahaiensis TaxID=1706839 RepID=A0A4U0R6E6_9RHOB|nr:hypothetical protein [Paracoccus gahaiensis]TJZ90467.1 hypothetical protein FA743_15085 [Paracoccus gahaiensis]
MSCPHARSAPQACAPDRRVATRPAHRCRGRGDRACRCHVTARPRLARPVPLPRPHRNWHLAAPTRRDLPDLAPLRPQAPPRP